MKPILIVVIFLVCISSVYAASSYNITTSGNMLELREAAGNIIRVFNSSHLDGLADGSVTTALGTSAFTQTLEIGNSTGTLEAFGVNFAEDTNDISEDMLVIENDAAFFQWNLTFTSGITSAATEIIGPSSAYRLADFEGVVLPLLGMNYTILFARESLGTLSIDLANGPIMDTFTENQTRTYIIDGVYTEVTLLDVNATGNSSRFMVEGELSDYIGMGEKDSLSSGLIIVMREVNTSASTATFAISGNVVEFSDSNFTDTNYSNNGVEVNSENIDDAYIMIAGTKVAGVNVTLQSISYNLEANPEVGSIFYVREGYGVRELSEEPEGLFSAYFDIRYNGLSEPGWSNITITPTANNETYLFTFTNLNDEAYTFPLLTNSSGVFKFGNETADFVFWEAINETTPNIGAGDLFVLTDGIWSPTSQSCIYRYDGATVGDLTANFTDLFNDNPLQAAYSNASVAANGSLACNGNIFDFYVENGNTTGTHRIAIDQNSNGSVSSTPIGITVKGGGRLAFINTFIGTNDNAVFLNASGSNTNITPNDVIGDGMNISTASGWTNGVGTAVSFWLHTDAALFEGGASETLNLTIESVSEGVELSVSGYDGPHDSTATYNTFEMVAEDSTNVSRTYTDYGAFVSINEPSNIGSNLTINYPQSQINATITIEMPKRAVTNNTAYIGPYIDTNTTNVTVTDDSFGFDADFSADTVNVTYTISNGTHTWSNASWNVTNLTASSWTKSLTFNALFLPVGNWTLNITATNSTGGTRSRTSTIESQAAMETTITSSASANTDIGGDDVTFTFNITIKSAGKKVAAYLDLSSAGNSFDTSYAYLTNGTHNATVSDSADYSGATNVTIPGYNSTPSYVTMDVSESIRNTQVQLVLTPYSSLVAGTYTGSYGFGVFG